MKKGPPQGDPLPMRCRAVASLPRHAIWQRDDVLVGHARLRRRVAANPATPSPRTSSASVPGSGTRFVCVDSGTFTKVDPVGPSGSLVPIAGPSPVGGPLLASSVPEVSPPPSPEPEEPPDVPPDDEPFVFPDELPVPPESSGVQSPVLLSPELPDDGVPLSLPRPWLEGAADVPRGPRRPSPSFACELDC